MAREEIQLNQVKSYNTPVEMNAPLFLSPSNNVAIKVEHKECEKMVLVFKNNSLMERKTATIKAGDGFMSNHNDLLVDVEIDKVVAVTVESGRYKQTKGEYKGYVIIDVADELGVLAIELP